jgi:hypothetical protein
MSRYVREVMAEERCAAAAMAMAWGYPRPIEEDEAERSSWVRYGDDVLVWFESCELPKTLKLHGCAAPSARGALGSPRAMIAAEVVAELLGAERLWAFAAVPGSSSPPPPRAMRRYLRMRGWQECEFGNFRDLGAAQ